jgi:hypothetical protein
MKRKTNSPAKMGRKVYMPNGKEHVHGHHHNHHHKKRLKTLLLNTRPTIFENE